MLAHAPGIIRLNYNITGGTQKMVANVAFSLVTDYGVDYEFEDPKTAVQMGFRGQKSATIFAGAWPMNTIKDFRLLNSQQAAKHVYINTTLP